MLSKLTVVTDVPAVQGGQKKLCFFHISLQPLPRLHRCKRNLKLSTQCECHSYWLVIFCTTNRSRVLAKARWQTFENSWEKKEYSMNTLYMWYIKPWISLFQRSSFAHKIIFSIKGISKKTLIEVRKLIRVGVVLMQKIAGHQKETTTNQPIIVVEPPDQPKKGQTNYRPHNHQ